MNEGQLHEISAEIGGLKRSVEIMTELWKSQEATASAGRRALHEKFDQFRQEVGLDISALSLRVDRLTDKVVAVEPSVTSFKQESDAFKDERLRQEGAKRLGVKLYAALMAAAGAIGWAAHEIIPMIWGKHP